MAHWVFKVGDGSYVGTRKATGRMYEARTSQAPTLEHARVFNTPQAATNSGRQAGLKGKAVEVGLFFKAEIANKPIYRCMGGRHCSHSPGTCTATISE